MKVSNAADVRVSNARTIVRELEISGEATNAEIALKHNISVPTVSNIVNLLKTKSILLTGAPRRSSGGRRASELTLNDNLHHFIGISIMKDVVYVNLIDFSGQVLFSCKKYIQFRNVSVYWEKIAELCQEAASHTDVSCSLAFALPGVISSDRDVLQDASTLGEEKIDLSGLYNQFGHDIFLGDACKLAGRAQLFGHQIYNSCVYILLSRRIGGVIIRDNELFTISPFDCHFGSMLVTVDPFSNAAGKPAFKTLSECCSSSHIIDDLREKGMPHLFEDFFLEIDLGNQEFKTMWQEYLYYLAVGLYNIRNAFGLHIVIGGEMTKYLQPCEKELADIIQNFDPTDNPGHYLHFSNYREYDEAIGAALYVRSDYVKKSIDEAIRIGS